MTETKKIWGSVWLIAISYHIGLLVFFISMHFFWFWIGGCPKFLRLSVSEWGYVTSVIIHSLSTYIGVFVFKALYKHRVFWKQRCPAFLCPQITFMSHSFVSCLLEFVQRYITVFVSCPVLSFTLLHSV